MAGCTLVTVAGSRIATVEIFTMSPYLNNAVVRGHTNRETSFEAGACVLVQGSEVRRVDHKGVKCVNIFEVSSDS